MGVTFDFGGFVGLGICLDLIVMFLLCLLLLICIWCWLISLFAT